MHLGGLVLGKNFIVVNKMEEVVITCFNHLAQICAGSVHLVTLLENDKMFYLLYTIV